MSDNHFRLSTRNNHVWFWSPQLSLPLLYNLGLPRWQWRKNHREWYRVELERKSLAESWKMQQSRLYPLRPLQMQSRDKLPVRKHRHPGEYRVAGPLSKPVRLEWFDWKLHRWHPVLAGGDRHNNQSAPERIDNGHAVTDRWLFGACEVEWDAEVRSERWTVLEHQGLIAWNTAVDREERWRVRKTIRTDRPAQSEQNTGQRGRKLGRRK